MSDTVPAAVEKPKPYVLGPLPGGALPEVGKLLNETIAEFTDNFQGYLLAGLGHFLVLMPVTVVSVIVVYVGLMGGFVATLVLGGIGTVLLEQVLGDLGAQMGALLTTVLSMVVPAVLLFGMIGALVALLAPLNASLYRAIAAHQRGEQKLELTAAFTAAHTGIVPVVLVTLATVAIALALMMFCYLPALAVPILLPFAFGLVALGGVGPVKALTSSARHSTANLQWYVVYGLLSIVLGMVASNVPVLGMAFLCAFHVRAYRYVFGDGPAAT